MEVPRTIRLVLSARGRFGDLFRWTANTPGLFAYPPGDAAVGPAAFEYATDNRRAGPRHVPGPPQQVFNFPLVGGGLINRGRNRWPGDWRWPLAGVSKPEPGSVPWPS